jgi:hypothetical protein
VLSRISVVVCAGNGSRDSALYGTMSRESTIIEMSTEEKKFKGFPMFFTFENLKRAFLGDMR